jgi:rod shape-determining protein MreD
MNRQRTAGIVFWGSLVAGLLLTLVALPEPLRPFRPFIPGLLVIDWALEAPDRIGLGFAFCLGVVGDLVSGSLIGEQALRLTVIAFIVLRLRPRMRFFPMLQQSLAVLALLVNDRVVMLMVRLLSGDPWPDWTFWVGPLGGMLMWPWMFLLLDVLRQRARPREA